MFLIGAITAMLLAELALFFELPLFENWFYNVTWWSFIVLLNALVQLRRGESLLFTRPRAFFLLIPWSCAFWLLFEAANFVLENWYYVNSPRDAGVIAFGIFISFATVLPGTFGVAELLGTFRRRGREIRWPRLRLTPWLLRGLFLVGVAFLLLPLAFPRYAFPLIWGATFFLLEPVLAARGQRGVLTQLAEGRPGTALRYLAAGLVCGLCWEFWNYWATSKWIYTVPFFEDGKLFEMPVLGFLGFPPFALECYTFGRFLVATKLIPEWELDVPASPAPQRALWRRRAAGVGVAVLLSVPIGYGVGRLTIRSFPPTLVDLGMPVALAEELGERGILTAEDLVVAVESDATLAEQDGLVDWIDRAAMAHTRGMGVRGLSWLGSVQVFTLAELGSMQPWKLARRIEKHGSGPAPAPTPAEVGVWVRGARQVEERWPTVLRAAERPAVEAGLK